MEACEVALPAMLPRTVVSLSALTDRTAWLLQECNEALPMYVGIVVAVAAIEVGGGRRVTDDAA